MNIATGYPLTSPRPFTSPWAWAVPIISLCAGLLTWLLGLNETLFLAINQLGRSELGSVFWANTTILGDTLVAFALSGLLAKRRLDIVWVALLAALFTTAWVHVLKPLFDNPRPLAVISEGLIHVIGEPLRKGSFPSGHTATVFTLAGAICLQGVRPVFAIGALLIALLAGVSRAIVGAHWPLDICAGAFGGWLAAYIGHRLAQRWPTPTSKKGRMLVAILLLACSLSLLFLHDTGYPAFALQIIIAALSTASLVYYFITLYRTT